MQPEYESLKTYPTIESICKKRRIKKTELRILDPDLDDELDRISVDTVEILKDYFNF